MNKYRIKNQILKGLIGNVATISEADHLWLRGFTHGKGIGTTVLTYLVKSAFNFQRFPLFEDRHFTKEVHTYEFGKDKLKKVFTNEIFLNQMDEIILEIQDIYKFTQEYLNDEYTNQDYVKLYRNLEGEYAALLLQLKNQAINENCSTIKISTDILNSFTDNPLIYAKDVHIEMDIPKKDILYYSRVFDYGPMESQEFVVFNQSKDGLLEIPIDCIFKTYPEFDENKYRIDKDSSTTHYYCNFAINTEVNFGKHHEEKTKYQPESIFCKILKKFSKCT